MSRIAIFGGAFDPPTLGHTLLAKCVINRLGFDEVWMMPSFQHPFGKHMSEFEHRMAMCLIAVSDMDRVDVTHYEAYQKVDGTLSLFKKLQKSYPENQFYFVIGLDNANMIDQWINPEELIKKVPFVVVYRQGYEIKPNITWYRKEPHIFVETCDVMEISSTVIRAAIKNNDTKTLSKGLNKNVLKYIKHHKLYE